MSVAPIVDDLSCAAERDPDRVALIARRPRGLLRRARRARRAASPPACGSAGSARGDRVAILLPNDVDAVVAIQGALRAGAALMPINPTVKRERLG